MKAAVLRKINQPLSIEDISIDTPSSNEVLVQTKASGVCRSDLHFIQGSYSHDLPVILGHEVAGIVEKVGSNVTYLSPGDTVVGCVSIFCGRCERCLGGRPALCLRDPMWGLLRSEDDNPKYFIKKIEKDDDSPEENDMNILKDFLLNSDEGSYSTCKKYLESYPDTLLKWFQINKTQGGNSVAQWISWTELSLEEIDNA